MLDTLQSINASILHDKLKSEARPVLINVLSEQSYVAKHIPGSINIPLENIEMIEAVVPDKEEDIVLYCANADCDASPTAAEKILDMGYSNVWDFEDGLAGWNRRATCCTDRKPPKTRTLLII
ncbi:MAG: rhodanese-like domain-containing protein [Balneolaceae bacterium]|nr:rhodanese-like domain-containing protein [Balneolaceae bacterium]